MRRSKEKDEFIKRKLMGTSGEPVFNLFVPTPKIEVIHALNYYSTNHDADNAKAWAIEWFENEGKKPEVAKKLNQVPSSSFVNKGFVCRMMARGFAPSDALFAELNEYFEELAASVKPLEKKTTVSPKKKKVERVNPAFELVDNAIEDLKAGKTIPKSFDFSKATVSDLQEVATFVMQRQAEMISDVDQYTPESIKMLRPFYISVEKQINGILTNPAQKERKQRATKPVSVSSVVKMVKYAKEFPELRLTGITPEMVVGKKKLIAFDTKYRLLRVYTSEIGFSFVRAKLVNFDEDKAFFKRVKNPEEFFKDAGVRNFNFQKVFKLYSKLPSTVSPLRTGLFNENLVLLAVE